MNLSVLLCTTINVCFIHSLLCTPVNHLGCSRLCGPWCLLLRAWSRLVMYQFLWQNCLLHVLHSLFLIWPLLSGFLFMFVPLRILLLAFEHWAFKMFFCNFYMNLVEKVREQAKACAYFKHFKITFELFRDALIVFFFHYPASPLIMPPLVQTFQPHQFCDFYILVFSA